MEEVWREARWIMDALQFARYKQPTGGVSISKVIDFSKEVMPEKPPSSSSQTDFMPSPMPSPEPGHKHSGQNCQDSASSSDCPLRLCVRNVKGSPLWSADFAGLSDEEGSSEVFLTTDSDYDSSRAQSPRELDLLPPSPLSSSAPLESRAFLCSDGSGGGGRLCVGRGGGLRDSTPDVLQASEMQHGREGELCGGGGGGVQCGMERRRGGPEQFDSDFILPSRQIELLHITEKRQAFCVRTSSLEFPSSTPAGSQLYCSYSPSPSNSPQRRWHRPSSVDRCCSAVHCLPPLPPARTLSQDSGTQRLSSPSPAAIKKASQTTLRVYPQYCSGLPQETSVKVRTHFDNDAI